MKDSSSSGSAASTAPVGARHDDSSLFTLDALKKTEDEARQQQKKSDDSGLIDLKALAALAQERPKQPEMAVASVVAPPDLFAIAAPIVPMIAPPITTAAPEVAAPKPNRTGLFVGVGAAVAVLACVAAFAATRGPAATAATATATAAPPPPPAVTTAPQPDEPRLAAVNPGERPPPKEDPKPAVTATATAAVAAKPPAGVVRGPLPKPPPKDEAPPPPPKPACDLACQMQRAVNKGK